MTINHLYRVVRATRSNRCCNFVKATHANVLMSDPNEIRKNIIAEPGGWQGIPATRPQRGHTRRAGGG